MWNNSDISCRNTENISSQFPHDERSTARLQSARCPNMPHMYLLFLWNCQGLAGNADANVSLHTHLSVLCSTEPFSLYHEEYLFPCECVPSAGTSASLQAHFIRKAARLGAKRRQGVCTPPCFLQLVLRLICLHPYKRAICFECTTSAHQLIQHSIRDIMLQCDATMLTGVLPLHIHECRLVSTLNIRNVCRTFEHRVSQL